MYLLPAFLYHSSHPKQAKVSDDHFVGVIEHVVGLQILVDDAFGVQITHSLCGSGRGVNS